MPVLVGFQTIVILDPYGISFNAVGVFVWTFNFYLNLAHHTVEPLLRSPRSNDLEMQNDENSK